MKLKKLLVNILTIVLLLSSVFLGYILINLNVVPGKYLIPSLVALALVTLLMLYWLRKSKGNMSKVIGFLLVVALIVGATQTSKIRSLIKNVTGGNKDLHTVHVRVMKDSDFDKMSDFKDNEALFGANMAQDAANINKVKEQVLEKEKFEMDVESYTSYSYLVEDLYDGSLDAIIMSEAHEVLLEEIYPNFEDETRIIATYEFEEIIEITDREFDVTKDTYSVFVSGIDTFGSISSVSRSDVNMIMTVNPAEHQILLTSIPRDYYVVLNKFGAYDKLTHAGLYGVQESVKTLEDLLSSQVDQRIDIDHHLRVNFTSVVNIVDALGGVEVNSKYAFKSGAGPYFEQGSNYINGTEALAFVRERYNLPNGDFDRIQNQQALITGVINKAMSPAIITNYSSFLNSIGDGFELSMSDKELNSIIRQQLNSMSSWDIVQIQLKGTGATKSDLLSMPGYNLYVAEPDYDSVKAAAEMILMMENGQRISQEDYQAKLGN